uniref:Uncharacterized protein n=1 Tax=Oryza meridionalis TaxID=40149 RepID=A0A0E0CNR6_9ORYZ
MAAFTKLEDSPMFRKQVNSMEQLSDELKQRCSNLHKGCKRFIIADNLSFRGSLDEGYAGDLTFADALEAFGAGQDDPVSVAIGGPVMSKFTTAFRELGTYKELLRSQCWEIHGRLPLRGGTRAAFHLTSLPASDLPLANLLCTASIRHRCSRHIWVAASGWTHKVVGKSERGARDSGAVGMGMEMEMEIAGAPH